MAKRILVIDDDEDILTILNFIFDDAGYEPVLLNTGTTAEEIKIIHPDLILLDVRIIGFEKSGAEICKEIRSQLELSSIPVLLLSAEHNIKELAQGSGANGFVSKPFDVDDLLSRIKEYLS